MSQSNTGNGRIISWKCTESVKLLLRHLFSLFTCFRRMSLESYISELQYSASLWKSRVLSGAVSLQRVYFIPPRKHVFIPQEEKKSTYIFKVLV